MIDYSDYDKNLTLLMEECAEVIQACAKIKRFGDDDVYEGKSGLQRLEEELGDIQCIVDILHKGDYISFTALDVACTKKYEKLEEWY